MILLAAVSFVLPDRSVNVASLLIARASARMREFAIQALGASKTVRQVLAKACSFRWPEPAALSR